MVFHNIKFGNSNSILVWRNVKTHKKILFPDWKIDTELLSWISLSNWINSFLQNKCWSRHFLRKIFQIDDNNSTVFITKDKCCHRESNKGISGYFYSLQSFNANGPFSILVHPLVFTKDNCTIRDFYQSKETYLFIRCLAK